MKFARIRSRCCFAQPAHILIPSEFFPYPPTDQSNWGWWLSSTGYEVDYIPRQLQAIDGWRDGSQLSGLMAGYLLRPGQLHPGYVRLSQDLCQLTILRPMALECLNRPRELQSNKIKTVFSNGIISRCQATHRYSQLKSSGSLH